MTDASSPSAAPSRKQRLIETAVVMAITLVLDLWSKAWAWENLRDAPAPGKEVIKDWFYLQFGFNTGAAFSFLRDASYARMVFIGVTVLALIYMARLAWTMPTKHRTAFMAVALVAGGALGNLHDRLVRQFDIRGTGELQYGVVDFIKVFYWEDKPWPTFNIADVALVVGVGLLFVFLTRHGDALDGKKADNADGTDKRDDEDGQDADAKDPGDAEDTDAKNADAKDADAKDAASPNA